jgi:hypothetical protein
VRRTRYAGEALFERRASPAPSTEIYLATTDERLSRWKNTPPKQTKLTE